MKRIRTLLYLLQVSFFVLSATAAPLSGTKTIGPTGDYASITAAIVDVKAQTLGSALVLELQPTYLSTVETFPLVFSNLTTTAVNTLTLRPQTGATNLLITSADTTAATVDLNGVQFLTIDGRPGGVGSNAESGVGAASQITIANTYNFGRALRFINEARGNAVRYTTLRGMNAKPFIPFPIPRATVAFGTTTGANGNDNNTLDHCDIRDGASLPTIGIYSAGTTDTTAQNNSGNIVSNCNIFNFSSGGVNLDAGNTHWTITGNSFYQSGSPGIVSGPLAPIFINSPSGNNFTVTGNFIGGSVPNTGGPSWTMARTSARFTGIGLNVGSTIPSSVQGNTIANIAWSSSSTAFVMPGIWSGIYVQAGAVNIGTETGNTIGSGSGVGSVSAITSGDGGTSFGIGSESSGTVSIANNTVGSITVTNSTGRSASLVGIQVSSGTNTISNNTVGSAAIPSPLSSNLNSLNAATSSFSLGQQVTGILSSNSASTSITGNMVANLNNNCASGGGAGRIGGIVVSFGMNTITGNTVRNLSTTSPNSTFSGSGQSLCGILVEGSSSETQIISQNTVHSLVNTAATTSVYVTGILFNCSASGGSVIERNLVHSVAASTTSTGSVVSGMDLYGIFTAQNNMVCVGLNADGNSTAGASWVRGIYDNGSTGGRNFYHNSVYLGGLQTSGANSTFALYSSGSGNARTFQNNLFINARSNNGGTGKHYVVQYEGTGVNPVGLTAGGNIFYAPNTSNGGVLGYYDKNARTTLAAWQAAIGQDTSSAVADPRFIAANGTAATVNLHLQSSNPAEGGGIPLTDALTKVPATVVDDFDGQKRSTFTPVDVGADAGNFTPSIGDIFAPVINYKPLSSGITANRVLPDWAIITDNSGTVSGGASAPRLYFKKSTDADAFGVANNSTGNGWKYVTALGSGPYSFTLNYALINGGSVTIGDTIQYFVVAQDVANNLVSSPAGATASANPPVQTVNGHGAVNSFSIVPPLSGMVTVGAGGTYPSLSGSGGLFDVLNSTVLTGNVVVNITSDLTETGNVTLSEFNSNGRPSSNPYTLTIHPDSATMRTISGSAVNGLTTLNGADRVTIDGRIDGSGRYLTFRNSSSAFSASTILFINDASSNTLRNCVVEGTNMSGALGVIFFSTGTVNGNDNNLVTGCQVRDLSTSDGVPNSLISSIGNSDAVANSNNTVSDSELFNFNSRGINIASEGNESWTLSGNTITEVRAATFTIYGILVKGGGTNVVTGNSIRDLLTTGSSSYGILFGGRSTTTIARNHITAVNVNQNTTGVYGIYAGGSAGSTLNVVNNQITLSPIASVSRSPYGIYDTGLTGSVHNVFYNSVAIGGTESGTRSSWASYRNFASTYTARNNLFLNLRTGGTGSHFAAGIETPEGSFTASNNVYAGTGATAANFMDISGNGTTPVPVNFETWQSSTGDTNSQSGIAGSGNFTNAMFVNTSTGDIHLIPGGNALVNALGIPIPSVIDDYDGDPRPAGTPTIGSDEFVPSPDIAVGQTSALIDGLGSVDFGSVTLGSTSSAKTFTITNPGSATLNSLTVTGGSNEFAVSALSGPSVPVGSSSVTFTVIFTPAASGARNATLQIASNVIGIKNPFGILLTGTGNAPPTFSGYTLKAKKNTPVSIGLAKILARAADSDGGTLIIATVSATSTQGGSVSLGASSVSYTPPLNFTGLDTFAVSIMDGQGGSVVGTVTCAVSEGNAAITNQPQITRQPGGNVALLFLGIPGQLYNVQRSTDLQNWTLLETATTAPDGTLPSLDPSPPEGSAFYRIVVP